MPGQGPPRATGSPNGSLPPPAKRGQACERCWRRKQKCDRLIPTCTACADVEAQCVARSQDINSLLAEDAGLSHSSINSYVESLKRRVAELEKSSQSPPSKRPRVAQHISPDGDGRSRTDAASATPADMDDGPSGEDSSVRDTMGAIGFLSNSAMAEPRTDLGAVAPDRLALTEVVLAALSVAGHDPSTAAASSPSIVLEDHQVPLTREGTIQHFRLFADWTFFVPYLDQRRLLEHFEETVAQHGTPSAGHAPPVHRFNTYLAIATGIMMSQDANRLSFLSSSLHALAVKLLPSIIQPHSPLDSVHCMAMLLFFSLISSSGGSSWHLLGLAMKTCIALSLHKDSGPQSQLDSDIDPRWMFWTLYIFDRALSSVMDRPFSIQDSDISVQIPLDSEVMTPSASDFAKSKAASSRHFIRQAQLISNVRDSSDVDPMFAYHNLCFWRDSPPNLRDMPIPPGSWADTVDQLACRSLIHIVRPTPQAHTAPGILRGTAEEVEADTVDSCKRLINSLYDRYGNGHSSGSFIDAYDVLSAAVVLACLVKRLGRQEHFAQVLEGINKASSVTTQISGRFPALRAFQELLLKLSARMMEEHSGKNGAFFNTLATIPVIIPRRLRQFIQNSFQ